MSSLSRLLFRRCKCLVTSVIGVVMITMLFYYCPSYGATAQNVHTNNGDDNTIDPKARVKNARYFGHDSGFWGAVDSTVDWCEPNYVVTYYIAEFWNTLSSIPMSLLSIFGMVYSRRYATTELRYQLPFFGIALVGFGSVAFHGTLRYYAQLLDELPMIIGSFLLVYCLLVNHRHPKQGENWLLLLSFVCALLFVVYVYVSLKWYAIFLACYCGSVFVQIAIFVYYTREASLSRKLFRISGVLYSSAVLFWMLDILWCANFQPFHFHSVWHLLAGYGSYFGVLTTICIRGEYLKSVVELTYHKSAMLPFLSLKVA